jgi:hypothetical protein
MLAWERREYAYWYEHIPIKVYKYGRGRRYIWIDALLSFD